MRLRLAPDCTTAAIEGRVTPDVLRDLDGLLSYFEPGARFVPAYKLRQWDGKTHLFDLKTQTFPAGLTHRVLAHARAQAWPLELIDDRPSVGWAVGKGEFPVLADGTRLYDEQTRALRDFMRVGRGCIVLPTGAGKTVLAAMIAKLVAPGRVLMIADRKSLTGQTWDVLERHLGERVGLCGGGRVSTQQRVTVATIQWLWHHFGQLSRGGFFAAQHCVIYDEAHSISPKQSFRTLRAIPAPVRLGLSATIREAPRRMIVESYIGPIVHEQQMTDLVEAGRLAEGRVQMIRMGGFVSDADDPYVSGVVRNDPRNRAIVDLTVEAFRRGLPTLILVVRIEHGQRLAALCRAQGLDVPFVHGQSHPDEITDAKRRLESRQIPAVIASTIFDKGIDVPSIRVLICAGAQRSPLLTIQRAGRAIRRKATGPNTVDILDFFDFSHRMLESQASERERTYKRKGYDTSLVALDDVRWD